MPKPEISIIVPVYNVEEYLRGCLDSILNQTMKNIEIICVNDASTDRSLSILREYSKKDPRLKVINVKKNINVGGARNLGLKAAKAKYIMFVDSDDKIIPECCELLYNDMINNDVDLVLSYTNNYTLEHSEFADNRVKEMELWSSNTRLPEGINDYCFETDKKLRISVYAKLYKNEIIKKHNILFPGNLIQEDEAFGWMYMPYVKKIYSESEVVYYRLIHEKSIMAQKLLYNVKCYDYMKTFPYIYKNLRRNNMYEQYKDIFKVDFYRVCSATEKNHVVTEEARENFIKLKMNVEYKLGYRNRIDDFRNSVYNKMGYYKKAAYKSIIKTFFSVANDKSRVVFSFLGVKIKFKNKNLRKKITKIKN